MPIELLIDNRFIVTFHKLISISVCEKLFVASILFIFIFTSFFCLIKKKTAVFTILNNFWFS